MEHEGRVVLPAVLAAAGVDDAILVGHSDGGSIALVCAATHPARLRALILEAPHVFCEELSVRSIAEARRAFLDGDLRERLSRHHADVDGAFWGWNRAWLDPEFPRAFNLERYLPAVALPTLILQGLDDPYGTPAQIEAIARGVRGPVEKLLLPSCGHAPHRDRTAETLAAMREFIARI
jgi:pimeloyl-ACP methyl ester carboxylesterase